MDRDVHELLPGIGITRQQLHEEAGGSPPVQGGEPARRLGLGRCRKHAPSMGGFPVVTEADWCGDHRLGGSVMQAAGEGSDPWQHRSQGMRCVTCMWFVAKEA